jgi:hypothetical protein
MRELRGRLRVESLEDRRMLAITIAGGHYLSPQLGEEFGYVAPPQTDFSPIAMPNGIAPRGTAELPFPPGGELPPGMPQFTGLAEASSSALAVNWIYTHEDAVGDVTESLTNTTYTVSLAVRGANGLQWFAERDGYFAQARVARESGGAGRAGTGTPGRAGGGCGARRLARRGGRVLRPGRAGAQRSNPALGSRGHAAGAGPPEAFQR